MIDAIGTMLQGSSTQRVDTQQPVLRSAQQDADPRTPASQDSDASRYYSPVVRLDPETQRTVLQYRDAQSGKVIMQYPSEKQLEAYRNRAAAEKQGEGTDNRDEGEVIAVSPDKGRDRNEVSDGSTSSSPFSSPFSPSISLPARPDSGRNASGSTAPTAAVPGMPATPPVPTVVSATVASGVKPQIAVVA